MDDPKYIEIDESNEQYRNQVGTVVDGYFLPPPGTPFLSFTKLLYYDRTIYCYCPHDTAY
jgi:hypothetical protein